MRKCKSCGLGFEPVTKNQAYCTPRCKRNEENRKRRLGKVVPAYDTEVWELEERRKEALLERRLGKNEWILENKTFAMFDIESTHLDADFGRMLCAVVKPLGDTPVVLSALKDDAKLSAAIRDELSKYDYIVTWYGTGFDIPYLQTRLMVADAEAMSPFRHVDMYYTSRSNFRFASNRLSMVTLSLFGHAERTQVVGKIWNKAGTGDKEANDYIIDHCVADVGDLEAVFLSLVPYRNLGATPLKGVGTKLGPYETIKEAKL